MKAFLAISTILLASLTSVNAEGNYLGCIDPSEVRQGQDLFPQKVKAVESKHWDIEYFNTYKILHNTATGKSWLLYQCGTTPPPSEIGKHQGTFKVPLQAGIATTSTTDLTHVEQLGLRRQLKGHVGGFDWIGSPCFKRMAEDGIIEAVNGGWYSSGTDREVFEAKHATDDGEQVVFLTMTAEDTKNNTIHFSGSLEEGSKGIYEWHKVLGALFNLEEFANEQFDASVFRYDCAVDNASFLANQRRARRLQFAKVMTTPIRESSDTPTRRKLATKPKVLWASHTKYGYNATLHENNKKPDYYEYPYNVPAWDIGDCDPNNPNYYCTFVSVCQGDILHSNVGDIPANSVFNSYHKNLTEFLEFGKDADIWLYPGTNFEETLQEFPELKEFKSVKDGEVYDIQKTASTWFEHRISEYGTCYFIFFNSSR